MYLKPIDSNFDSGHQKEIIMSDNNDFTINTEQALMHIDGSHKTYTFMVHRDPANNDVLENLLIDIDTLSNTTRQLLVSYPRLGDSYDFQYTEITEINDANFNDLRTYGCYDIWYYETSVVDFPCKSGKHTGESQLGDCNYQGTSNAPYSITEGNWITVEECPEGSDELVYGDCTGCVDGDDNNGGTGGSKQR